MKGSLLSLVGLCLMGTQLHADEQTMLRPHQQQCPHQQQRRLALDSPDLEADVTISPSANVAQVNIDNDAYFDATTLQYRVATTVPFGTQLTCTLACDSQSNLESLDVRFGQSFSSTVTAGSATSGAGPCP